MAYFHSQFPLTKRGRVLFSVLGETRDEMLTVARRWPDCVLINLPPRGKHSWRSKSLPHLYVDVGRRDVLETIESTEVPLDYMVVLRMMLREAIFNETHGSTEDSRKYFELEVRGKIIQLLRSGSWVDNPSSLGLKKLNGRIENCDLGRRSDLKFSSAQSDKQKYDQDLRKDRVKAEPERVQVDWTELDTDELIIFMQDAPAETVRDIWSIKPWLHGRFAEAGLQEP